MVTGRARETRLEHGPAITKHGVVSRDSKRATPGVPSATLHCSLQRRSTLPHSLVASVWTVALPPPRSSHKTPCRPHSLFFLHPSHAVPINQSLNPAHKPKTANMKYSIIIAALVAAVAAQDLAALAAEIPACAKPALDAAATAVGCTATDYACQCGAKKEQITISASPKVIEACGTEAQRTSSNSHQTLEYY